MSQVTVRAVLFPGDDPATAVASTPGWHGVVDGMGGGVGAALSQVSTRRVVERQMSSALVGLLGLDLADVLVGGWRRHRALVAAAHATRANAAATEVVQLATHRITTSYHPYVDVSVNGAKVATVHFDLDLTLDVDGVLGTVSSAKLVALQGGRCTVAVALGCEGRDLASRQAVIDPVLTVRLGRGIPLLREERSPAPAVLK